MAWSNSGALLKLLSCALEAGQDGKGGGKSWGKGQWKQGSASKEKDDDFYVVL